jgi:hypothetical protein
MILSPAEQVDVVSHMSAQEPRMFPGVIHERTRRNSVLASATSQDMGNLGPALARMALKEKAESTPMEEDPE